MSFSETESEKHDGFDETSSSSSSSSASLNRELKKGGGDELTQLRLLRSPMEPWNHGRTAAPSSLRQRVLSDVGPFQLPCTHMTSPRHVLY
ncbi:hypothetical protein Cni_G11299 [Canna indica]|uniref:Uncharacterized protein n=1 Tax=Canna indica TaxID=4628 RepID=A0AAQ3QBK7_9LILI|nr:hypothetical protein Cni_G11299 [Canna indica]